MKPLESLLLLVFQRACKDDVKNNGNPHGLLPFEHRIAPGETWRQPAKRVLFLDFDGVLHPGEAGTFRYLPMLEALLRRYPLVDVVISSNWRERMTFGELIDQFSEDMAQRIVGTTPAIDGENRQSEIETFCRRYGIQDWLVLDDRAELFSPYYWRLQLIDGRQGLRDTDLALIEHWLRREHAHPSN